MASQAKSPKRGHRIPFNTFLERSIPGYNSYLCTGLTGKPLREASELLKSHCTDTLDTLTDEKGHIKRFKIGQSHATNRLRKGRRLPLDTEKFLTWRVDKGIAPLWNNLFRKRQEYDCLIVLCGLTEVPEGYLSAVTQAVTSSKTTEATETDSDVLAQDFAPIHDFTEELHKRLEEDFKNDKRYGKFTGDEIKKIDKVNEATKEASCGAIYLLLEFEKRWGKEETAIYRPEETGDDKWRVVLESQNEEMARKLLAEKILPENELFQKISKTFGKKSRITEKICKLIGRKIRRSSRKVVDVWPAYKWSKRSDHEQRLGPEQQLASKSDDIVFVVITKTGKANFKSFDYQTHHVQENKFSKESTTVNEMEKQITGKIDLGHVADLINKKGEDLINKHSNITIISPSSLKSIDFEGNFWRIKKVACIVIYTQIKGYIPITEEPFPTEINGVDVDVREGAFFFCGGKPESFHDTLRMGLKIYSDILLDDQHVGGTLGGFVDHKEHGVCCFTCAHVLYPSFQHMKGSKKKRPKYKPGVHQPLPQGDITKFGHVVEAVCLTTTQIENTGAEVALVKIEQRSPLGGDFPKPFCKDRKNGLDKVFPNSYKTGAVADRSALVLDKTVYKYGATTRRTTGTVKFVNGVVFRKKFSDTTTALLNQMVIEGEGFADFGDSGSLVFTKDKDGNLAALGMIEGKDQDGQVYITPIEAVLGALGLPIRRLKSFSK